MHVFAEKQVLQRETEPAYVSLGRGHPKLAASWREELGRTASAPAGETLHPKTAVQLTQPRSSSGLASVSAERADRAIRSRRRAVAGSSDSTRTRRGKTPPGALSSARCAVLPLSRAGHDMPDLHSRDGTPDDSIEAGPSGQSAAAASRKRGRKQDDSLPPSVSCSSTYSSLLELTT